MLSTTTYKDKSSTYIIYMIHVSLQIPSYYDTEYGNDYDDLEFFLDDDFARRSLIGGECSTGCFIWLVLPPKVLSVEHKKIPTKKGKRSYVTTLYMKF